MITLNENKVFDATITSSTEASGFGWDTALNDITLTKVGRTTSDSSQWLKFAFDNVKTVDYVAILGHNLSEDATIVLEGNNTDVWTSPSFSETISISDNGNFYNNKRIASKIYQDITNSFSGVAPAEFDHYNDNNYNTQQLEEGSIYDSVVIDMQNESEITWEAVGNVNILFRDSSNGSSWSAWTSEIDATTSNRRDKVLRYMQYRLFFNSPSWGDTTSYFQLLSPDQESQEIIIGDVTRASYKYWRITLDDPENTDGYIEIGLIYLGVELVWPGMNISKVIAPRTTSEYSKSATGQLFPTDRIQLKYVEISFNDVEQTDMNNIKSFTDTVDVTLPFILLVWEESLDIQPALYVNLTEMITPTKEDANYLQWGFTFKGEECK